MKSNWPRVAILGSHFLTEIFYSPANALGIDLVPISSSENIDEIFSKATDCDLVISASAGFSPSKIKKLEQQGLKVRPTSTTIEKIVELQKEINNEIDIRAQLISVAVARSPHGQASSWAPTLISGTTTITPVPNLKTEIYETLQASALEIAERINLVGVISVNYQLINDDFRIFKLEFGIVQNCMWTLSGSITNIFEQYLRSALDLPLGDTSLISENIVSGQISKGSKKDMYRPYLHLMARSPKLKFFQYRIDPEFDIDGHISMSGENLEVLIEEIKHAQDYFSGVVED